MLLGNKPDPGRQIASRRECLPIANLCNQRCGNDWPNARNLLEPSACFAGAVPGMDALLDRSDLHRKCRVLPSEYIETEPGVSWNLIAFGVGNNREQLCGAVSTLGRYNAELSHVPTDRIRQHCTLTNQKLPAAMQHQA